MSLIFGGLAGLASIETAASTQSVAATTVQPKDVQLKVLDSENSIDPKHLGQIADVMCEWEGRVADELGLTDADVADIKEKCTGKGLKLQL